MYPPKPAAMIIQMGDTPNSQMSRADTTGIHIVNRLSCAALSAYPSSLKPAHLIM